MKAQHEPKSPLRTAWTAIHEKAPFEKRKIKTNFAFSKASRQPGECRVTPKTLARREATRVKIEGMKKAAEIRRALINNPTAKRTRDGTVFVQPRQNGRFMPRQIILTA